MEIMHNRLIHLPYRFLKFIGRRASFWLGVSVVSGVVLGFLEIALSFFLALILRSLGVTQQIPRLPFGLDRVELGSRGLVIALILIGAIRAGIQLLTTHSASVAKEVITIRLRLLSFHETFKLKAGFVSLSDLMTKLSDFFPKASGFVSTLVVTLAPAIESLILLTIILRLAPMEAGIGIAAIVLAGASVHLANSKIRILSQHLTVRVIAACT